MGLAPPLLLSIPAVIWDKPWQLSPAPGQASEGGLDAQSQPSLLQPLDCSPEAGSGVRGWAQSMQEVCLQEKKALSLPPCVALGSSPHCPPTPLPQSRAQ